MKLVVTAKPKSKKAYVKKIDEKNFIVSVHEPAGENKANEAIVKALADYFKIPPYQVQIISGYIGKQKIIEIL